MASGTAPLLPSNQEEITQARDAIIVAIGIASVFGHKCHISWVHSSSGRARSILGILLLPNL